MTKNNKRKVYRYREIMLVINVPDRRDYSEVSDEDLVGRFEKVYLPESSSHIDFFRH